MNFKDKHFHFIGIGGAGMSSLAETLLRLKARVSGSDQHYSEMCERLSAMGAQVFMGHDKKHLYEMVSPQVVVSSAIPFNNEEWQYARDNQWTVCHRAELLACLMEDFEGIAVCGAHGKTTTTALLGYLFAQLREKVMVINGGKMLASQSHSFGEPGKFLLAEADESDASFLKLPACHALITNIDYDHMDTYHQQASQLETSFLTFAKKLPPFGKLVLNADDPLSMRIGQQLTRQASTFGFSTEADVQIQAYQRGRFLLKGAFGCLEVNPPAVLQGRYQAQNIAACVTLLSALGLDVSSLDFSSFKGVARRANCFDLSNSSFGKLTVVDDYAHHPVELEAIFAAICEQYPARRIVTVFQPHRYTRTRDLADDFVQTFKKINPLILMEIYSAGESAITGIDGLFLVNKLKKYNAQVYYAQHEKALKVLLANLLQPNDVLLTLGAGSIGVMSAHFREEFLDGR